MDPYGAFESLQADEAHPDGPFTSRDGPFTSQTDEMFTAPLDEIPSDAEQHDITHPPDDLPSIGTDSALDEEDGVQDDLIEPVATPMRREPSTRIRRPIDRLNLIAVTPGKSPHTHYANMSVVRAMRLFPEKTSAAMESEVRSLLGKETFSGAKWEHLTPDMRKKVLRSHMNVVEKYLPTLDETGNRAIDKVKARLCVDGRGQDRADYHITEIESPTANVASILTIAQIAAKEHRFIMVGDVGTAYLNARMPSDDPAKRIHMTIDPATA